MEKKEKTQGNLTLFIHRFKDALLGQPFSLKGASFLGRQILTICVDRAGLGQPQASEKPIVKSYQHHADMPRPRKRVCGEKEGETARFHQDLYPPKCQLWLLASSYRECDPPFLSSFFVCHCIER